MGSRALLRLVVLVECACALLLAWASWRAGMAAWLALVLAVVCVALVRLAINLNNFAVAARHVGIAPAQLSARAALHMLAEEFSASMLASHWHMAGSAAPHRIYPDSARVPVLLVHGYTASAGYWKALAARLDAAHISHASIDLVPFAGDIDGYVPAIEQAVKDLCAATGAPRVAIVAHSMGGLVARAWMRAHGTARLARLITLGTPHHGTLMARFGVGANAAQMGRAGGAPGPWLQALAASETAERRARITSLWTRHDNIVAPSSSCALPGARNVALQGIGHVALGSNPRVLDAVLAELEALR